MMFRPKWSRALIVLAMLLCLFTVGLVGTPSAHAAAGALITITTTKTFTVKTSAPFCAFLQKSFPTRAGDAHLCDITLAVKDVITRKTGIQSASLSPNACYPVVNHSASYDVFRQIGLLGQNPVAGFSQSETFTYGCTPAPVISNHQCYGVWIDSAVTLSQMNCIQYPNGSGHTQAEDDVAFTVSGETVELSGYSDGQPNESIYDWCSGC